jgi:hypothetical protein
MPRNHGKLRAAAALCAAAFMMTGLGSAAQAQSQPMMQNQPMTGGQPMMRDQDMAQLGDQLRNCRGEACVPVREQMMTQLRDRLRNCAGGTCEPMREQLRLHEQVQSCPMDDRACRELRMQEREAVRPHPSYGSSRGRTMGQGMEGSGGSGN